HLNGYGDTDYIIVRNMGVNEKYRGYGARCSCVNPETVEQSTHDAYGLEFIADKKDGRIQLYIMDDEPVDPETVLSLFERSEVLRKNREKDQRIAKEETDAAIEKGRAIIEAKRPAWAKAVIVGCKEIDDCDLMTDHFNTKSGPEYLLAWSKHTRDIFSEMRKAALNHPETKHLAIAPDVDSNGEKKTESNKSWWTPADEHREKYSMGAGYYLKATHRYDTGWKVCKWSLSYYEDQLYWIAGEGRYCIPEKATPPAVKVEGVTVTENEGRDGVEVRFPGRPDQAILDGLKTRGFRWSRFNTCWYRRRNAESLAFANGLV
ncbi:hypothetical protein LCGC14_2821000, partial [marine sediment metagenome]